MKYDNLPRWNHQSQPHAWPARHPRRLCLALRSWRRILRRPRLGRSLVGRRSTGTQGRWLGQWGDHLDLFWQPNISGWWFGTWTLYFPYIGNNNPNSLANVRRTVDEKTMSLPDGSDLDCFGNLTELNIPFIGASLISFKGMEEYLASRGQGPAVFVKEPSKLSRACWLVKGAFKALQVARRAPHNWEKTDRWSVRWIMQGIWTFVHPRASSFSHSSIQVSCSIWCNETCQSRSSGHTGRLRLSGRSSCAQDHVVSEN